MQACKGGCRAVQCARGGRGGRSAHQRAVGEAPRKELRRARAVAGVVLADQQHEQRVQVHRGPARARRDQRRQADRHRAVQVAGALGGARERAGRGRREVGRGRWGGGRGVGRWDVSGELVVSAARLAGVGRRAGVRGRADGAAEWTWICSYGLLGVLSHLDIEEVAHEVQGRGHGQLRVVSRPRVRAKRVSRAAAAPTREHRMLLKTAILAVARR